MSTIKVNTNDLSLLGNFTTDTTYKDWFWFIRMVKTDSNISKYFKYKAVIYFSIPLYLYDPNNRPLADLILGDIAIKDWNDYNTETGLPQGLSEHAYRTLDTSLFATTSFYVTDETMQKCWQKSLLVISEVIAEFNRILDLSHNSVTLDIPFGKALLVDNRILA